MYYYYADVILITLQFAIGIYLAVSVELLKPKDILNGLSLNKYACFERRSNK